MKSKLFKIILLFLISNTAFAGDDNVLSGAIFGGGNGVCAEIANIVTQPVTQLEQFLKGNSQVATIAYTLFAVLFIMETLWLLVKTYIESNHHATQNVAVKLAIRMITGAVLLTFVNLGINQSPDALSPGGSSGQNGLSDAIMGFAMGMAQMIVPTTSNYFNTNGTLTGTNFMTQFLIGYGNNIDTFIHNMTTLIVNVSTLAKPVYYIAMGLSIIFSMYFTLQIVWNIIFKVCEFTIVVNVGVFLLGFLGSEWTKDYFKPYLNYLWGLAIEFMVIVILFGFINQYLFGSNLTAAASTPQVSLAIVKLIIFTIFGYQLMKLSGPIAKALGGGTAGISTGEGSAMAFGAVGGAVGASKMAGAAGEVMAAGGISAAGAAFKTLQGASTGALTGAMDSWGSGGGGFSQFGGAMLGAAKGASAGFGGSSLASAAKTVGSGLKDAVSNPKQTLSSLAKGTVGAASGGAQGLSALLHKGSTINNPDTSGPK